MTPEQAARTLLWLIEAGADEIVLDQPRNRFDEVPPIVAPRLQSPLKILPVAAARPEMGTSPVATAHDAQALAEGCISIAELDQTFRQFDVNGLRRSAVQFCFLDTVDNSRVLLLADRPRTEEEQDGGIVAGKQAVLLRNMLASISLAMPRTDTGECVSLGNMVPWRPPGNRNPNDIETASCLPFMKRAVSLLRPRLILSMGVLAGKLLAGGGDSVAQQRGRWLTVRHEGLDIPLLATFPLHELLGYPERKRHAWRDLLMFRERLDTL